MPLRTLTIPQDMWMKLAEEWAAAAIRAVETSRDGADEVSSEASN